MSEGEAFASPRARQDEGTSQGRSRAVMNGPSAANIRDHHGDGKSWSLPVDHPCATRLDVLGDGRRAAC
ncbi:hypothetical protein MTO96_007777 [Rhipicephalus appendiculatus]